MTVQEIQGEEAEEFLKELACPKCKQRVSFLGTGQAGIMRVSCYTCDECDVIFQVVVEKRGVPMFDEVEKDGRCTLVPDKQQEKCNVCACGLYTRTDTLSK